MRDWISFFATVISPVLLLWVGFANSQIKDRIEQHNRELDRNFEVAKAQSAFTKDTLPNLNTDQGEAIHRLAVLTTLAYVDRDLVPPFMLSVLAIKESREDNSSSHIVDDLRTALKDLAETANEDQIKIHAARALSYLPRTEKANQEAIADVAAQAVKDGGTKGASPQTQATAKTQLAALRSSLATIAVSGENDFLKKRATSALAEAPADAAATENAVSEASKISQVQKEIPPRVYLHIASEDQRKAAQVLQKQLIAKNYIVPGIQNVSGQGEIPAKLQVRYFDPQAKESAESILKLIKSYNSGIDGELDFEKPSGGDATSSDIKTHFEVWAASSSLK